MPMRKFSLFLVALFTLTLALTTSAQQDKTQRPSPPMTASSSFGDTKLVINYGSPAVKGREIWGKLVPYGKVWRTGANEATTFDVSTDVMIEGKKLAAGRYALFTIPGEDEWTIIFNKTADQWGAYGYKAEDDALRVVVKPASHGETAERLVFHVIPDGNTKATVTLYWEKVAVGFDMTNVK